METLEVGQSVVFVMPCLSMAPTDSYLNKFKGWNAVVWICSARERHSFGGVASLRHSVACPLHIRFSGGQRSISQAPPQQGPHSFHISFCSSNTIRRTSPDQKPPNRVIWKMWLSVILPNMALQSNFSFNGERVTWSWPGMVLHTWNAGTW